MSLYLVIVPKKIKKAITKIPLPWQLRIIENLRKLETNPLLGAPMQGKLKENRKIVVWPYRIIYQIKQKQNCIIVVEVKHRGNISYG